MNRTLFVAIARSHTCTTACKRGITFNYPNIHSIIQTALIIQTNDMSPTLFEMAMFHCRPSYVLQSGITSWLYVALEYLATLSDDSINIIEIYCMTIINHKTIIKCRNLSHDSHTLQSIT